MGCCIAGRRRTAEGHLPVALAEVHVAHAELAALHKDRQVHLQPQHRRTTLSAMLQAVSWHRTRGDDAANGGLQQGHKDVRQRRQGQPPSSLC